LTDVDALDEESRLVVPGQEELVGQHLNVVEDLVAHQVLYAVQGLLDVEFGKHQLQFFVLEALALEGADSSEDLK